MLTILITLIIGILITFFHNTNTTKNVEEYHEQFIDNKKCEAEVEMEGLERFLKTIFRIVWSILIGFMIALFIIPSKTETSLKNCHYLDTNNNGEYIYNCKNSGYIFYYKNGEDFKRKYLSIRDKIKIKQTNNKPKIEKLIKTETNDIINYFSFNIDEIFHNNDIYIIYLPKNYIKNNTNLQKLY